MAAGRGGSAAGGGGWWVAAVALVPASSRPYIGGSQHNSVLELALGYNGLGRLNGEETGGLGNLDQDAGWGRMFGPVIGGQISWLLPAALVLLTAGLWATRRAPRTDPARAALAQWGGCLLLTAAIFSRMQGIFHEYYTVALAPAIAALTGIGAALAWERRRALRAPRPWRRRSRSPRCGRTCCSAGPRTGIPGSRPRSPPRVSPRQ